MKQVFDTDAILFDILKKSPIKNAVTGNIYVGEDRPDDSQDEDIVVNTLALTQDYHPQIGTSNVNIYVPDMNVKIKNKQQTKSNRVRLKALSEMAITALRDARISGVSFTIESQTTLAEPNIKQHFVNIRISWNIQTN